jgi:hypothetical protein
MPGLERFTSLFHKFLNIYVVTTLFSIAERKNDNIQSCKLLRFIFNVPQKSLYGRIEDTVDVQQKD